MTNADVKHFTVDSQGLFSRPHIGTYCHFRCPHCPAYSSAAVYYRQDTKCAHISIRPSYPSDDSFSLLLQFLLCFLHTFIFLEQVEVLLLLSGQEVVLYVLQGCVLKTLWVKKDKKHIFNFLRHAQISHNASPATSIQNNANKVV